MQNKQENLIRSCIEIFTARVDSFKGRKSFHTSFYLNVWIATNMRISTINVLLAILKRSWNKLESEMNLAQCERLCWTLILKKYYKKIRIEEEKKIYVRWVKFDVNFSTYLRLVFFIAGSRSHKKIFPMRALFISLGKVLFFLALAKNNKIKSLVFIFVKAQG